jgi:Lrp/AsnC family transcriptional regulator, regulator for asnA, asnC and gidA
MLGVTEGTIRNRVATLLKTGIINIKAYVNPIKLGYKLICIMAFETQPAYAEAVTKELVTKPNIIYLASVTGRYDLISIIVAQTPEELSNFIKYNISNIPYILRTETFVNLEILKSAWTGQNQIDWDKLVIVAPSAVTK